MARMMVMSASVCLILGMASCGGGGSSGGPSSAVATPPPTTPPTQPPPPTTPVNLHFVDYHYHGGYYSPVVTFHFTIQNDNTQNITLTNVPWIVRNSSGATVMSGTIPSLAPGGQWNVEQTYTGSPAGNQAYTVIVDPAHTIAETDPASTSAPIYITAPTTYPSVSNPLGHELIWYDPHIHHFTPNGLTFALSIENIGTSNTTITNIPWQVTQEDGTIVLHGVITSLAPGATAAADGEVVQGLTVSAPGEHIYTLTIDPNHTLSDDDSGNNSIHYEAVVPVSSGG